MDLFFIERSIISILRRFGIFLSNNQIYWNKDQVFKLINQTLESNGYSKFNYLRGLEIAELTEEDMPII